jgi:hypothetical protein
MADLRFTLHRRAFPAFHALTRKERAAVSSAVARLVDVPVERWPAESVKRLAADEPLYLLRVDESLRAIIRPTPDRRPEILDLPRHETLQTFAPQRFLSPGKAPRRNSTPSALTRSSAARKCSS